MRLSNYAFFASIALLAASPSKAADPLPPSLPAAPQVTVGANLKELTFDWAPVPGAVIYRLMANIGEHSYFIPVGDRIPAWRPRAAVPIAVHLENWQQTRYLVQACNLAGCTRSAVVDPGNLMLDSIGYVKSSNSDAQDRFGRALALSIDGSTMAVSAERESSNASGVNGNQASNASANSGAVYVYRRVGRKWVQEAYIKALYNEPDGQFGSGSPYGLNTLAISLDGSLLAVGAPARSIMTRAHEGTVYIYRRAADNTWSYLTHLVAPSPGLGDYFGYSVDMSQDGRMIKVSSLRPHDSEDQPVGRTHLFVRTGDDTWELSVTLAPYYSGDRCHTSRLNGNGTVLVSSCMSPLTFEYRAVTMRLIGGAWVHAPDVPLNFFMDRQPIAINYHGTLMAINEGGGNDGGEAGAWVGVYRWGSSGWVPEVKIGQPRFTTGMSVGWAKALEFDRHGHFLAIGDAGAPFLGAGVMNRIIDGSDPHGAVYLYEFRDAFWQSRSFVKAPNPATDDQFGTSLALSGDGHILAVGAVGEDSAARGVDGNQNNEGAPESGAVYLY